MGDGSGSGFGEEEEAWLDWGCAGGSVSGGPVPSNEAGTGSGLQEGLSAWEGGGWRGWEAAMGGCGDESIPVVLSEVKGTVFEAQAFKDGHAVAEPAIGEGQRGARLKSVLGPFPRTHGRIIERGGGDHWVRYGRGS